MTTISTTGISTKLGHFNVHKIFVFSINDLAFVVTVSVIEINIDIDLINILATIKFST